MSLEELPRVIDDLRTWLIGQGFCEQVRNYSPTVFGNWLIVLVRALCRVQIVRDRSQWFIDISGDGLTNWYDTDLWRGGFDGRQAPVRPIPLDDATAFVRASLAEIKVALETPDGLDRCLRLRAQERYDRSSALVMPYPAKSVRRQTEGS